MDPIAARIATQFPTLILNGVGTVEAYIEKETDIAGESKETKKHPSLFQQITNMTSGGGYLYFDKLPNYVLELLQNYLKTKWYLMNYAQMFLDHYLLKIHSLNSIFHLNLFLQSQKNLRKYCLEYFE